MLTSFRGILPESSSQNGVKGVAANYNLMTVAIQPPLWTFTSSSDDTTVLAQLPTEPSSCGSSAVVRLPSKTAGAWGEMADGGHSTYDTGPERSRSASS